MIREFNGIKVGVFGILTPDTANSSKPGADVRFLDPYKQRRAWRGNCGRRALPSSLP
ncbi:MAG: hypothetical protein U0Y68_00805 [Blastocatellia bacterium]